jgi:hypothetical protein
MGFLSVATFLSHMNAVAIGGAGFTAPTAGEPEEAADVCAISELKRSSSRAVAASEIRHQRHA